MRSSTRLLAVVLVSAVMGALAPPAAGEDDPNAYVLTERYLSSEDGTRLHAFVYRPAALGPDDPTPVILQVTPYAGTGGHPPGIWQATGDPARGPGQLGDFGRVFERGYTYAVVSLRGRGGSDGCYDIGGPGEQADVRAAVRWAASADWSNGKVGMWGLSYPGQMQLIAMAAEVEGLEAVVIGAPPTGMRQLYTNGAHKAHGRFYGPNYLFGDLTPPSVYSPTEQHTTSLSGTASNPTCYATSTVGTWSDDADDPFWAVRDLVEPVKGSDVPTLWVHGFNDYQVRPHNFAAVYPHLAGPKRLWLGPWDHIAGGWFGPAWTAIAVEWYDHWLRGLPLPDRPAVSVQSRDGSWRGEDAWPPADAEPVQLALRPGTYVDAPGNNGETGVPQLWQGFLGGQPAHPLPTGRGIWSITPPLTDAVHVAGVPHLDAAVATAAPAANLVALVYDIDADGMAHFVQRGVSRVRGDEVAFDLYPIDHRFPAGHRIGVLVTGADDLWWSNNASHLDVEVLEATLVLPALHDERTESTTDGPFRARTPHAPFEMEPDTIAGAEVPAPAAG